MKRRLELVREKKLYKLLPGREENDSLEASGVTVVDGSAYVIFDNLNLVGKLNLLLKPDRANRLIMAPSPGAGFEAITYDARKRRFYLIIEAVKDSDGKYRSFVVEYDQRFRFRRCTRLSTTFERSNKGFEGVAHLWRGKKEYLLGMCEGNMSAVAAKSGGRIHVFERTRQQSWKWSRQVALPPAAEFKDYAAINFRGSRVAIVSQASSRLWIGEIDKTGDKFIGDGTTYKFPDKSYGNVEGVAWLTDDLIVAVSDRRKANKQPLRCASKDQSIHIFRIPAFDRSRT